MQAVRALAAIRKLFNWQIEIGELPVSPCDGLRASAKVLSRNRVLSDQEVVQILITSEAQGYRFKQSRNKKTPPGPDTSSPP
ncbi:MAG: hypothetical protein GY927_18535 [bacterium]|nr:hypothetical protein [bacterium]